ncbi:MAG: hypothetical protein IAF38_04965, partial [Bacteroidia bacterium]|nr:hypothetical protein [Bacteroidia bacterium]
LFRFVDKRHNKLFDFFIRHGGVRLGKETKLLPRDIIDHSYNDNQYSMLKTLADIGADINFHTEGNSSNISNAIDGNNVKILELLIEKGAKADQYSHMGENVFEIAIRWSSGDCLRFLLHRYPKAANRKKLIHLMESKMKDHDFDYCRKNNPKFMECLKILQSE